MSFIGHTQEQQDPAAREKEMRETLEREIDHLTDLLKLTDSQVFYVDSIMTHDTKAMQAELESLSRRKVENIDLYTRVQDKWAEQCYQSLRKVFNDEQWEKYNKKGAARDHASRMKREAKRK